MPSRTVSMHGNDAAVGGDLVVQRGDPLRALILRIQDLAAPECVVDRDQAAGGQPGKDRLVVGVLTRLVRVDEDEVELALELLDRLDRRTEVKCDLGAVRTRSKYRCATSAFLGSISSVSMRPSSGSAAAIESAA